MKKISIVCVCLTLVLSTVGFSKTITNDTIYVDDDGTADYNSIQDAINAASAGDTIYVYSGTYYEHSLRFERPLILKGEDKNTTIIDARKMGKILWVFSDDVTINGFTFCNGSKHDLNDGIWMESSSDCIISNCIFQDMFTGIVDIFSSGNQIKENQFFNNTFGIALGKASTVIKNNYLYNHNFGIDVQGCKTTIENNIISKGSTPHNSWGISMRLSSATIRNNVISDFIYGITLWGMSCFNMISGNEIINNHNGIEAYDASMFNRIVRNNISHSTSYGVYLTFTFLNSIKENNFIDNSEEAFLGYAFGNRWVRNYWDDHTGVGPKIIRGNNKDLPLFNIDWRPAETPYKI